MVAVRVDSANYDRTPFGIKMCEQLCQSIRGCSVYMFLVPELSCHVTNTINWDTVLEKKMFVYNATQVRLILI